MDEVGCIARNGSWDVTDAKIKSCPRECQVNGWWDEYPCMPSNCGGPNCRKPAGSSEGKKVCYGCQGSVGQLEMIDDTETDKVEVDLNGPYVVKVISSTVFSLHYEKNLDFETMSSKIFGYDPTTNVPNPVPPTPPVTPTGPDPALNTKDDKVEWDTSVKATEWGHEVMVGPAVGPFTNKEIDWASMSQYDIAARWTRHAGSFYVVLNKFQYVDKDGTACRQGNSDKALNLSFNFTFENACCNNRQPPHNMECQPQCYQGGGPVILDWVDHMQDRGKAPIGLAITEYP